MPVNLRKRTRSETPPPSAVSSPSTSTKKSHVTAPPTPVKGKAAMFISREIAESSRLIPSNARPSQVDYSPLDQLWTVFGNPTSTQYLKNATTREKYACLVKYFYGRLVLLVYGLYLPEITAIFRTTLPVWHNSANSEVQDNMEEQFGCAYDWVNHEVVKKIRAYSYALFQTSTGKAYEPAWTMAK